MRHFYFNHRYLGFCVLFLSGCVNLPKEQQSENLITPPSLQSSVQEGVDSALFAVGDWPEERWWEIFASSELNALIDEALAHNPTLQSVAQRIEQAKQESKVAKSRLFPLLFFDANESLTYLSRNGLY